MNVELQFPRRRYNYLAKNIKKSKVIYVVRNPKHAAIELYNASFFKRMDFKAFTGKLRGINFSEEIFTNVINFSIIMFIVYTGLFFANYIIIQKNLLFSC